MGADQTFLNYLSGERDHVESALQRAVEGLEAILPPSLGAAAGAGVMSGGKRLRPILLVTAYRECLAGGRASSEAVYELAASVELIHAYSLMHDDLPCMDDAPLRRGQPTPHTIHGVGPTTWAGAALIPWALRAAYLGASSLGLDATQSRAIARVLGDAAGAGGMVGGQALDLLGEGKALDEDALRRLHGLKTGALLTAALRMGAMAAGASEEGFDLTANITGLLESRIATDFTVDGAA